MKVFILEPAIVREPGVLPYRVPNNWMPWVREYRHRGRWLSVMQAHELGLTAKLRWDDQASIAREAAIGAFFVGNPEGAKLIAGDM